jgi:hypothetical protein
MSNSDHSRCPFPEPNILGGGGCEEYGGNAVDLLTCRWIKSKDAAEHYSLSALSL